MQQRYYYPVSRAALIRRELKAVFFALTISTGIALGIGCLTARAQLAAPPTQPPQTSAQLLQQMSSDWTATTNALGHFIESQNKLIVEMQKEISDSEAQKQTLVEWLSEAQAANKPK